jgi:methylthioribose-1-phosphate isomerase
MSAEVRALVWDGNELRILDQRLLPGRTTWIRTRRMETVAQAIETLAVRGAPAIGVAAGYGVALAARERNATVATIQSAIVRLASTRPTGYNLFHVLDVMRRVVDRGGADLPGRLLRRAIQIHRADAKSCLAMARFGLNEFGLEESVLTYCNTGALATGGIGTALGVIKHAFRHGRVKEVYACETRPVGQGARLTVWECVQAGLPVTLITDNMAAALMMSGRVQRALVGADRIARNGDTSNKIGTLSVAMLAYQCKVPFHVVAPITTFDSSLRSGRGIPIEERDPAEVLRITPGLEKFPEVRVWNPSFDVTPRRFITSYITDSGVVRPPFHF